MVFAVFVLFNLFFHLPAQSSHQRFRHIGVGFKTALADVGANGGVDVAGITAKFCNHHIHSLFYNAVGSAPPAGVTSTYRTGLGFKTGGDTYTYDDEANTVIREGSSDTQTKYLNENGDPIRIVTISHAAGMEMETLYEYDELGRNVKTIHYQDGVLAYTVLTSYDDQGRMVKNISYDANGTAIYGSTVVYEENTVTTVDLDGYRSVETLRPNGLVEKLETFYTDGNLRSRTEYTYQEIQIRAKEE